MESSDNMFDKVANQTARIAEFLEKVHPFLLDEDNRSICIEIRPLQRDGYQYDLSKSLNLWNLNDESRQRLYEYLKRHENKRTCLFYSIYAFDYWLQTTTQTGKAAIKGKINSQNAIFTQEIALDFDNVTYDEYEQLKSQFNSMGIEGIWVSSGHGVHLHILLKEKSYDKSLLKTFVDALINKGIRCDPSCIDPSRIIRLPYTINNKAYSEEKYHYEIHDPPVTSILDETNKRYSLDELMKITGIKKEKATTSVPGKEDVVALEKIRYPVIEKYNIPEPIMKMLICCPEGFRNKALGFLVRYFKTYMHLSKTQIEEILTIWAKKGCSPPYPKQQFDSDLSRFYFSNGLNYDKSLVVQFGYMDFINQVMIQKQDIYITNEFLDDLDKMEGNMVKAYLGIKLIEHVGKIVTIDSLSETLEMSTRAIRPLLQGLIKLNHIYIQKGNRKLKEANLYFSNKIVSLSKGYYRCSYNDLQAYLNELNLSEIRLYLFMSYKFFSGECFMSQKNIGEVLGLKQNTISVLVQKLEEKFFIRITKTPLYETKNGKVIDSCTYTLLR